MQQVRIIVLFTGALITISTTPIFSRQLLVCQVSILFSKVFIQLCREMFPSDRFKYDSKYSVIQKYGLNFIRL